MLENVFYLCMHGCNYPARIVFAQTVLSFLFVVLTSVSQESIWPYMVDTCFQRYVQTCGN